jgi:cytochrome P450
LFGQTTIERFEPSGVETLWHEPLNSLERAGGRDSDVAEFAEDGPVSSRLTDCSGTFAVFGAANIGQVLRERGAFIQPPSLAERFNLPPPLTNLSSGIFSMNGEAHRHHRRMLRALLTRLAADSYKEEAIEGCEAFLAAWADEEPVEVLGEMRRLSLEIFSRIVFGAPPRAEGVETQLQQLLLLRRMHALFGEGPDRAAIESALVSVGERIDASLRSRIAALQRRNAAEQTCLLARMASLEEAGMPMLSEDELVAHASAIFLAASEPVAVALTWALIALSQFRSLRAHVATQVSRGEGARSELLGQILMEGLRLLPPSAVLLRTTARPVVVAGCQLPARAEVMVSPFVAHRDPGVFRDARTFDPRRWHGTHPSPHEYLPFGAGDRSCLGSYLAMMVLRIALASIFRRHAPALTGDQSIDWHVAVTLMPATNVHMTPGDCRWPERGGRIDGPLREMIDLS